MSFILQRHIFIEKFPHPGLKSILENEKKAILEQDYEAEATYSALERNFYRLKFGYEIANEPKPYNICWELQSILELLNKIQKKIKFRKT